MLSIFESGDGREHSERKIERGGGGRDEGAAAEVGHGALVSPAGAG